MHAGSHREPDKACGLGRSPQYWQSFGRCVLLPAVALARPLMPVVPIVQAETVW